MKSEEPSEENSIWSQPGPQLVARWFGILLFVGIGFLYLITGLLAPVWVSAILLGFWVVMLVWIIRIWRRRPWLVLVSPFIAYAVWVLVLLIGGFFLGWSA